MHTRTRTLMSYKMCLSLTHAIGTARAIEMGEVEGAMSGLSVAVSGLVSVVFINLFALLA